MYKCGATDPCRSSRPVAAQSRRTSCGSLWRIRCHPRAARDTRLPAASTFVTDVFQAEQVLNVTLRTLCGMNIDDFPSA